MSPFLIDEAEEAKEAVKVIKRGFEGWREEAEAEEMRSEAMFDEKGIPAAESTQLLDNLIRRSGM